MSRARAGPQKDEVDELLNQLYVSYDKVIYTSVNVTVCFPKSSFYCRVALSKCETNLICVLVARPATTEKMPSVKLTVKTLICPRAHYEDV